MSEEMNESLASTSEGSVSESTESSSSQGTEPSSPITFKETAPTKDFGGIAGLTEKIKKSGETPKAKPTSGELPAAAPIVPPAYTPNFKYKYLDAQTKKQVEGEFEEWARQGIKDADTEKKVRDFFEKVSGFDGVKSHRDKFKYEAEAARYEIMETKNALNTLSQYVQSDDMESFFEALKIPEDKVLQYALRRIQYRELPEEKKREYDRVRETQSRAQILEEQNQMLATQHQQFQVQTREQQLAQVLGDPQVQSVAESFNQRMQNPDAFRQEVIKRGAMYWHLYKQDVPAETVAKEVAQLFGMQTPQAQAPAVPSPMPSPAAVPTTSQPKPVLPNIQGKGSSPAKKMVRSLADLKTMSRAAE